MPTASREQAGFKVAGKIGRQRNAVLLKKAGPLKAVPFFYTSAAQLPPGGKLDDRTLVGEISGDRQIFAHHMVDPNRAAFFEERPLRPPVVFLSDFGRADPYVGQVHGVLRRHCSYVGVIDLHHEVPPFDIQAGAWLLERTWPHMPEPAIWLCVVDPGVGGDRRILLVKRGESILVGPDNGLLGAALAVEGSSVYALEMGGFETASATFHGRDIMAPTVGRLLNGAGLDQLGSAITDPRMVDWRGWRRLPGRLGRRWETRVMLVDHFGNLVTALPAEEVGGGKLYGEIQGGACGSLAGTFSDIPLGEAGLVVGGFGAVEVVVNQGSARDRFQAAPGSQVVFFDNSSDAGMASNIA